MPESPLRQKRRLAAILAADVVGYSRLIGLDEEGTLARLRHLFRAAVQPAVAGQNGRIFKVNGDGLLAEFGSAMDALLAAAALQSAVRRLDTVEAEDRRIAFRIGLHVGDVVAEQGDLLGDGVNIAARLESIAEPHGVVLSAAAREALGPHFAGQVRDLGEQRLKNIDRPVRAYAVESMSRPVENGVQAPAVIAGLSLPDRPSLAVLPFREAQPDSTNAHVADGLVDEIIHALGSVRELFVIARTSTLGFGGGTIDVRLISRDLGVRYVLHGTVRRAGDRLRVGTELSDASTGQIIRTDRFDGEIDDIFDLQARISQRVLRTIAPHVRERELQRSQLKRPENLTGYERVLQAKALLERMDAASHAQAEPLLRDAIAADPSYAAAYSWLAYWYIFRIGEGRSTDPDADSRAAAAVSRTAMELDRNDARATALHAYVLAYMFCDHARALMLHERALEISPNMADAWTLGSLSAGFAGDGALAVARARNGLRLSPLDTRLYWHEGALGQAHYVDGNYEEAVEWASRAAGRASAAIYNLRTLAASLVALGRIDDAHRVAGQLLQELPNFSLAAYRRRCAFTTKVLDPWIERLRAAGLPD